MCDMSTTTAAPVNWLGPKAGRSYKRQAYVCEGTFRDGMWLAHPFSEYRTAPPCGFVESPGTPQRGRGYYCPQCGGALLLQWVDATYVDLVEDWVEAETMLRRASAYEARPR